MDLIDTEQPFVSVIICVFNGERLIKKCLERMLAQTYPVDRFEVIIVDDDSNDNTFSIVSEFINELSVNSINMRLIRIAHGGLSVARNSGIRVSKGEIVAFIDQDAISEPTWIEEIVKPFHGGAGYVGGRINLLNDDSWVAKFLQHTRNRQFFGPDIFSDNFVGCNMAFSREALNYAGGFHETFILRGDETVLRMRLCHRFDYAPAPEAIVWHKRPDSIMAYVRTEWESATIAHLVTKAMGGKRHWKYPFYLLNQLVMIFFPILFLLMIFQPTIWLGIPLMFSMLAFFRRLYFRPLSLALVRGLICEYGFVKGVIGHMAFFYICSILIVLGRLYGLWLYRNEKIILPMTTDLTILDSVNVRR